MIQVQQHQASLGEANHRYENEFLNFLRALITSTNECDLEVLFTLLRFVPSIAIPLGVQVLRQKQEASKQASASTTTKQKRP
jgi:hypothetical protein